MYENLMGVLAGSKASTVGPFNGNTSLASKITNYRKADANGTFPDSVPTTGVDGTINGATFLASAKINGGYSFVTNDYINNNIECGTTFSVGGWFRFNDVTSGTDPQRCISERNVPGEAKGWYFRINNTTNKYAKLEFYTTGPTIREAISTFVLSTATWYFIGISIDDTAKTGKLFMNGSEVASVSFTGSLINGGGNLEIGRQSSSNYFNGDADEVFLAKGTVLSTQDWTDLYNSGTGLSY